MYDIMNLRIGYWPNSIKAKNFKYTYNVNDYAQSKRIHTAIYKK